MIFTGLAIHNTTCSHSYCTRFVWLFLQCNTEYILFLVMLLMMCSLQLK